MLRHGLFPFFYDEGWKLWISHGSRERIDSIALVFRGEFNSNLLHYKDFLILLARYPFNLASSLLTEENLNASSSLSPCCSVMCLMNFFAFPAFHPRLSLVFSPDRFTLTMRERKSSRWKSFFTFVCGCCESGEKAHAGAGGRLRLCPLKTCFVSPRELRILPLTMPWVQWNLHLRVEQQE